MLRLSNYARQHPARFLAGLVLASAVAYVPLALLFGPSDWAQRGPFAFQLSRPGHYAVYFLAGVAIGACGIERGLLAPDGPLARHGPLADGGAAAVRPVGRRDGADIAGAGAARACSSSPI